MMRLAEPLLRQDGALVVWMKQARLPADGIARSIGLVPSDRYVPESGHGIFAYTKTDAAPPFEVTTAPSGENSAPTPFVRKRGKLERKTKKARETVAQIDAGIVDASEKRAHAGEEEAARLAAKVAELEPRRAALLERIEIMASLVAAGETDPERRLMTRLARPLLTLGGALVVRMKDPRLPTETTPAPLVPKRDARERKIKKAEEKTKKARETVARIDAEILDSHERQAHAGEEEAARLVAKIAQFELRRAVLVERLEIRASRMPATCGLHQRL
jgi:hypothetical protein